MTPETPVVAGLTLDMLDGQIAVREQIVRMKYGALAATPQFAEWQHEDGKLTMLRELRETLAKQQQETKGDAP